MSLTDEPREEQPFVIVSEEDETTEGDAFEVPGDALDTQRVQRAVKLRRSAMRSRSHVFIVMALCIVAAIQLLLWAADAWGQPGGVLRAGIELGVALSLVAVSAHVASRAGRVRREAQQLDEASEGAPDFDRLGDGSHQIAALHTMVEPEINLPAQDEHAPQSESSAPPS